MFHFHGCRTMVGHAFRTGCAVRESMPTPSMRPPRFPDPFRRPGASQCAIAMATRRSPRLTAQGFGEERRRLTRLPRSRMRAEVSPPPADRWSSLTEARFVWRLLANGALSQHHRSATVDFRSASQMSSDGHDPGSPFEILPTESRISSPGVVQRFGAPVAADAPGHPPGRDGCVGRAKARGST